MIKKRDWLIIAVVLALALFGFALTNKGTQTAVVPEATASPEETAAPAESGVIQTPDAPGATAAPEETALMGPPVPGRVETSNYVVVTVNGKRWGDPIPMDMDKEITVKQENGAVNVVHITPETVKMQSSTCENQDCIYQDAIPLNYAETHRILGNMIVCLPNQVVLELVSGAEGTI